VEVDNKMMQGIEIITIDRRSSDVYSASFYVNSDSRKGLRHHVVLWFTYAVEEDFFGRIVDVAIEVKKYSCTCEWFTFKAKRCKHVERAMYVIKELIKNNNGGL
jgi:hypothetical protein